MEFPDLAIGQAEETQPIVLGSLPVVREVLIQLLLALFAIAIAVLAMRLYDTPSLADWMGVRRPSRWDGRYIVLGIGLMLAWTLGSIVVIGNGLGLEPPLTGGRLSDSILASRVVTLLLIQGPAEELIVRGVNQRSLRDVIGPWPAIVFAGVLLGSVTSPWRPLRGATCSGSAACQGQASCSGGCTNGRTTSLYRQWGTAVSTP